MAKTNIKAVKRLRRKRSIRKRISGTAERPRLSVFRSSKHIYAQLIDDVSGVTLAAASTQSAELKDQLTDKKKTEKAQLVGTLIANKAKENQIQTVVFDRNGFIYHKGGRVAALAEAAREAGLKF